MFFEPSANFITLKDQFGNQGARYVLSLVLQKCHSHYISLVQDVAQRRTTWWVMLGNNHHPPHRCLPFRRVSLLAATHGSSARFPNCHRLCPRIILFPHQKHYHHRRNRGGRHNLYEHRRPHRYPHFPG